MQQLRELHGATMITMTIAMLLMTTVSVTLNSAIRNNGDFDWRGVCDVSVYNGVAHPSKMQ